MPVVLQDLIDWLVPFLAGGAASGIALAVKWGRALIGGVRALLRADLNRIHTEYVQTGRPVNLALKDEADDIYAAYHALGATASAASCTGRSSRRTPGEARPANESSPAAPRGGRFHIHLEKGKIWAIPTTATAPAASSACGASSPR
ncbi:hypothetical protein CJD48_04795 [Bifidobacterium bifidum]|nr:hypothetical protein CJD48_04795 [Bifidobacterium bifidum]